MKYILTAFYLFTTFSIMAQQQASIASDAQEQMTLLKLLEGDWKVTASNLLWSKDPAETISGKMSAHFVYDGMFLEIKTDLPDSPIPAATALIGLDDTNKQFTQIYADERKVYRVYHMTLTKTNWTLTRNAPDFHQRFTATIDHDGTTIKGKWEKSKGGTNWERDFNLVYEKQ